MTTPIEYFTTSHGTSYPMGTNLKVAEILDQAMIEQKQVILHFGDANGMIWLEDYDVKGLIGRSMGKYKIPLLLARKDSLGGGAISTGKIRAIFRNHIEVYTNPPLIYPKIFIEECEKTKFIQLMKQYPEDTPECIYQSLNKKVELGSMKRFIEKMMRLRYPGFEQAYEEVKQRISKFL